MGLFSKVGSFIKENAHTILDVAGMIPGIGAVADLANAGLYAAEGDWVNAGLSAVSAIPGVGDTIALANKGMKVVKGAKTILKGGKGVKTLLKAGGKSIVKSVKGKMKVGGKLLKKLNPKKLYKSIKDKMKEVCLFGKCFTGDTLVYTEKGYVPIKEIKVGDRVYSRNEKTGETGYKKVEQISQTEAHTIYSIEVNDSTVIKTTAYHPFYVEEKGWISGINLKIGDQLVTPDRLASITKVSKERFEDPVIMYNFHVEDWVSYFVSVLSLYVHNGNCSKGNVKPNRYNVTDELKEHIKKTDSSVPRKKGIGGAHNKDEFLKNDVQIVSRTPNPNVDGVEIIEYQMPKCDKTGAPIPGQYQNGVPKTKTVYDPKIISDESYINRGIEAANEAASRNADGILGREWTGVDNQGVTWRGYCQDGKITSIFPE